MWDGKKYVAYSPEDDDHIIQPYEAFFVQKPAGVESVNFAASARMTKIQSGKAKQAAKQRRMARKPNPDRQLVNLTIEGNGAEDKTRVVFNPNRSLDYEIGCDAAKFMADGVPQIYSVDAKQVKYAINERPAAGGSVTLGYSVPAAGTYTIAPAAGRLRCDPARQSAGHNPQLCRWRIYVCVGSRNVWQPLLAIRMSDATGVSVIRTGSVTVATKKGAIIIKGNNAGTGIHIATTSGIEKAAMAGNGRVDLQSGVYVVSVGSDAVKVVVK